MIEQANSDVFAPVAGQTARDCWLGYGNALFLEFGQPQPLLDRETHPRGEWGLWSDNIEWRIEQGNRVIAGSEDDRSTMVAGVHVINGRSFLSCEISPAGDSTLTFSDDVTLHTFVISTEEGANWNFRDQQGVYSCVRPKPLPAAASKCSPETTHAGAEAPQQFYNFLRNSEIWRVAVNVQHRFEAGYEPSDIDSLRIDFRSPVLEATDKASHQPLGSLQVDFNSCGLRLERTGESIAAGGDSSQNVLTQLKQLIGKKLLLIDITPPAGDTDFVFEDGLTLRCFPATSRCADIWSIFSAQGDELMLGPAGRWSYKGTLR
ncbi:MAG: hypothetical protein WCF26_25625 [Candidatus Sulfotelmatobacter sp.]